MSAKRRLFLQSSSDLDNRLSHTSHSDSSSSDSSDSDEDDKEEAILLQAVLAVLIRRRQVAVQAVLARKRRRVLALKRRRVTTCE